MSEEPRRRVELNDLEAKRPETRGGWYFSVVPEDEVPTLPEESTPLPPTRAW